MEKFALTLQSKQQISDYSKDRFLMPYQVRLLKKLADAIENSDQETLNWFAQFGDCIRSILMNSYAFMNGLEFGFKEINLDKYGWLVRPVFLEREEIKLGDIGRFGNYSTITLGSGPNGIWTNAISCQYGCAEESSPLCVNGNRFANRQAALNDGLAFIKQRMTNKIGHIDTTNYKQEIILKTLRAIGEYQINMVQLSLF